MGYRRKFFQSYFWQTAGIAAQISSIFIVLPLLGENKDLFAVFVFLNSTLIIMNYLDFGFYSSTLKHAAEAVSLKEKVREERLFQVSFYILSVVSVLFVLLFLAVYAKPHFIFSSSLLKTLSEVKVSHLVLIHCMGILMFPLQRLFQGYFTIRIELFKLQKINVVASVLKIIAALLLFGWGYGLVFYFLFTKIIDIMAIIVLLILYKELKLFLLEVLSENLLISKTVLE